VDRLIAGFQGRFGLADTALTPEERAAAERLVAEQYGTDTWTHDLP
jgi:lipoate-protein ligase A